MLNPMCGCHKKIKARTGGEKGRHLRDHGLSRRRSLRVKNLLLISYELGWKVEKVMIKNLRSRYRCMKREVQASVGTERSLQEEEVVCRCCEHHQRTGAIIWAMTLRNKKEAHVVARSCCYRSLPLATRHGQPSSLSGTEKRQQQKCWSPKIRHRATSKNAAAFGTFMHK